MMYVEMRKRVLSRQPQRYLRPPFPSLPRRRLRRRDRNPLSSLPPKRLERRRRRRRICTVGGNRRLLAMVARSGIQWSIMACCSHHHMSLCLLMLSSYMMVFSRLSDDCELPTLLATFLGKEVNLPPESEEVAGFFGTMLETDHAKDATFQRNFFHDFLEVLNRHPVRPSSPFLLQPVRHTLPSHGTKSISPNLTNVISRISFSGTKKSAQRRRLYLLLRRKN